jgi:hypothetical protein
MDKGERMRKTISMVAAAALVAGTLVLAVEGAGARVAGTVGSRVSISFNSTTHEFKGRVRSSAGVCKRNRKVQTFRVQDGPDQKEGSDRTNRRGRYTITHTDGDGRYYAKALKKTSGNTTCKRKKSRTIEVDV